MHHLKMSGKHTLQPKAKHITSSTSRPPVPSIQVQLHQVDSNIDPLDLSFSSQEDYPFHIMGRSNSSSNNCGGDKRSRSPTSSPQSADESKRRIELENIEQHEKEWATLFERTKVAPELRNIERDISPDVANNNNNKDNINNPTNPFAAADALDSVIQPSPVADEPSQPKPKSILRRRLSSSSLTSSLTSSMHQKRQAAEIQSILQTLEELQHNFVTNDNSFVSTTTSGSWDGTTSTSDTNGEQPTTIKHQKEFTTISYPNGNLFSGTINSTTQQLIYGRMTCALEMEVYEGPFNKHGKRHGEGAVCTKMDGTAKFLGRYVFLPLA